MLLLLIDDLEIHLTSPIDRPFHHCAPPRRASSTHNTYHIYTTTTNYNYTAHNVPKILFQLHGSIWLQVLPYCLANVAFMLVLYGLDRQFQSINFSKVVGESSLTHTFGGLIVSFLLVTRINSALARYFECRQQISIMFQQTRKSSY